MSEKRKLKMIASTTASAVSAVPAVPDPEVRALAKRRQFSAAYKLAVLEENGSLLGPVRSVHC